MDEIEGTGLAGGGSVGPGRDGAGLDRARLGGAERTDPGPVDHESRRGLGEDDFGFEPEFLRKLERLELLARRVHRGTYRGERTTRRRGRGLEFADFRPYQPGDDLRYVDWNLYSRLEQLFVKLYASEEDLSLHLLVDVSASMALGTPTKFDYARRLAAAVAYIGLSSMDRVTVRGFSNTWAPLLRPLKSRAALRALLSYLSGLECDGETGLREALHETSDQLERRGLVVLISDLMVEGSMVDGVRALRARGHDVAVIHVLAEEDIDPPLDGAFRLVDAETGAAVSVTVDEALRAAYYRRFDSALEAVQREMTALGVDYLRASSAIPFEDVVLRYLRAGGRW